MCAASQPARVLVVDDSAYMRKTLSAILSSDERLLVVGTARDGEDALEKVENLLPDVITLDLIMEGLDGVGFMKAQMARRPLPVVIVSTQDQEADEVLDALSAGAVDFVQKPTTLNNERLLEVTAELTEKVVEAAKVARVRLVREHSMQPCVWTPPPKGVGAIVIGTSTGGPQAVRNLLSRMPVDYPVPLAIVVHMPVGYTAAFARRLDDDSELEVLEAVEGLEMAPGRAILGRAGRHLQLVRESDGMVRAHLPMEPMHAPHRPSVDELFRSASGAYEHGLVAVVLTGMGTDGTQGAAWVKASGGRVIAEAQDSCVVYGMPRAVVEAGLADVVLGLEDIAPLLCELV